MDYEDSSNFTNTTNTENVKKLIHLIFQEIIYTIFVAIGIIADGFIIYTIFKFKRMHSVPNILLANWAIADICSLIANPSSYRLITTFDNSEALHNVVCSLLHIDLAFHNNAVLFIFALLLDWCFAVYFPSRLEKLRNAYKIFIGILWTFILIYSVLSIRFCIKKIQFFVSALLFVFSYFGLCIFLTLLHSIRCIQKCRKKQSNYSNLMLIIGTVYTLSWLLGFLDLFVIMIMVHPALSFISECCTFVSAIVTFVLLFRLNKDFQACFLQILKRPENRYAETLPEPDFSNKDIHNAATMPISCKDAILGQTSLSNC